MEIAQPGEEVDAILGSLRDGIEKAEAALSAMLAGVASSNEKMLADLEMALSEITSSEAGSSETGSSETGVAITLD